MCVSLRAERADRINKIFYRCDGDGFAAFFFAFFFSIIIDIIIIVDDVRLQFPQAIRSTLRNQLWFNDVTIQQPL